MSQFLSFWFLGLSVWQLRGALALPVENNTQVLFDQRQTGKYNIHISIKDVAIIEVGGNDFQDETIGDPSDYYYDEGDLTVKPFPSLSSVTTNKPTSESVEDLPPKPINDQIQPLISTPSPAASNLTTKKTNVIILDPSSTYAPPSSALISLNLTEPNKDTIKEPILHPKQRSSNNQTRHRPSSSVRIIPPTAADDSKIFKFKARRSNLSLERRCRAGYLLDNEGNCRAKRSSSILKRLFSMLTALPINVNEGNDNHNYQQ